MPTQPLTADAVVIGGGVMGTSALYHLTEAGCADVVLLEREHLAGGSTGAAAGGIRAQFSDELNIRIAVESISRFSRFAEEFGVDIGFRQRGYLFLIAEDDRARFEDAVALQRSLGVPTEILRPSDAQEMVPGLRDEDLAIATFCPLDGSATPQAVVEGYAAAARRGGALVLQGVEAQAITVARGRVTGVRTRDGVIATPRVICTAGVWSRSVAATAGLDLPVTGERRYIYYAGGADPLPKNLPLVIDFTTSWYMHREGDGLLMGGPWPRPEDLVPVLERRLPALLDLGVRTGWSGEYEMSPDHNALVGSAAEPSGLHYATGFSGHGFQQAPVVGEYLAGIALDRPTPFDLGPFSAERFATAGPRSEGHVV